MVSTSLRESKGRARRFALAAVLWAFGLSTSTLLVGVWGRAVSADGATLTAGARAAIDETVVADRIYGWFVSEIGQVEGIDPSLVEPAVLEIASSPEVMAAVDALITETVAAALSPPGSNADINVGRALEPIAPLVAEQFGRRGVPVTEAEVDILLGRVGSLVLETEQELGITQTIARGRAVLTLVVVVGTLALLATGALALTLADDRLRMVRSLAIRLMVSAVTFLAFLRIGAWAVDPFGGRSPIMRAGVVVLSSQNGILVAIAGGAAVVATGAALIIRSRRTGSRARSVEALEPAAAEG